MPDDIVIFGCVLLNDAHLFDFLHIHGGTTVEDGEFGTVDLNEAVVDAHCIQGSQPVFDGRDADIAHSEYGTSLGIDYFLGNGIDDGLFFQIDSLNFISVVFRCGIESHRQAQAGVQSFSAEGETSLQCILFQHDV